MRKIIHYHDRDNKYMCNKGMFHTPKKETMTKEKKEITCKNCLRILETYIYGEKQK